MDFITTVAISVFSSFIFLLLAYFLGVRKIVNEVNEVVNEVKEVVDVKTGTTSLLSGEHGSLKEEIQRLKVIKDELERLEMIYLKDVKDILKLQEGRASLIQEKELEGLDIKIYSDEYVEVTAVENLRNTNIIAKLQNENNRLKSQIDKGVNNE